MAETAVSWIFLGWAAEMESKTDGMGRKQRQAEAHAEFIHYWVPPGMQSEKGWDVEITLITLSF